MQQLFAAADAGSMRHHSVSNPKSGLIRRAMIRGAMAQAPFRKVCRKV
jgi:hypothetical protein